MKKVLRKGQTMVEYIIIVALIAISLTYLSRAIGRKAAGASEALSQEEGQKAKSAVDSIDENTIKNLGEN